MTLSELFHNFSALGPELVLTAALCVLIVADMFTPLARSRAVCGGLALAGTVAALVVLLLQMTSAFGESSRVFFSGMLLADPMAQYFKLLFLFGLAATLLFSLRSRELAGYRHGEYVTLLTGATLSACLLASANNFVLFVVALETLSMCSYVLAGFVKHERRSAEAGLKYMLYGAVASGVMMFGLSYLFGLAGSLQIDTCISRVAMLFIQMHGTPLILVAVLLVLVGVGFKIAMVPFHFWCPDVYQGAPTPVTAFLSVVSKAAGFAALLRLVLPSFMGLSISSLIPASNVLAIFPVLFGIAAAVTMTFGNLVAIRQRDVKRLLAYSSIAHAGYLLMGLAVFNREGFQAMAFYLFIYFLMNLGAFWVVIVVANRTGGSDLKNFRGAARRMPLMAVAMFIFLISLTGLPPAAGFVGKLMLFKAVIGAGVGHMVEGAITAPAALYFALATLGVLNSAVSLYYYMKIMKAMVFDKADEAGPQLPEAAWWDRAFAVCLAVPLVGLLIQFGPLYDLATWCFAKTFIP